MRLVLTTSRPWHTNYCTEEGQVIYKVDSPWKLVNRSATIDKIMPNNPELDNANSEPIMQDQFTRIAKVDYRAIEPSSKITFQNTTKRVDSFFRKGKMNWKGHGSDRMFTAPDGKEYRWVLGSLKSELFLNDEAKTPVAKYHLKHYGIIKDVRPASLEIFPSGEHIVDHIIVTFVYLEKLRKERQDAAHSNGGGG
ncbi:hypothetical protein FA15DRAFT_687387 [Coprinopsis marcescibilis]|uniref:DUF6593 domain-containing protein n=1 Tax=Coprinopsis marcescibilis TaxID=230819 RepID=A0A5C3L8Q6_COPMA|nr:hypothetical protein FA15DRAFT_687387 [Coprinopsis marcescibilis]